MAEAALVKSEGGRPTLYRPEYCDEVERFCADGMSLTAFAGHIGVSRRTIGYWMESHPDFADACEIAKARACAWYESQLRKVAMGEGGPGAATAAMFGVKNFGDGDFSDRRQLEHVGSVSHRHLTYEQALEEARRRGLPVHVLQEGGYLIAGADSDGAD